MSKISLKTAARRMELADTETGKQETPEPVNTGNKEPRKRGRSPVPTGTIENRIKCTYGLDTKTVEALEGARLELRRMVGRNIKRYEIIEAALALALEDLKKVAGKL